MDQRRVVAAVAMGLITWAVDAVATPGALDTTFGRDIDAVYATDRLGPGVTRVEVRAPSDYVNAHGLAVEADGRILAVFGEGYGVYGFLPDGLPDPSFGTPVFDQIGHAPTGPFHELRDMLVQPDGTLVAVGIYQGIELPVGTDSLAAIVRLLPDGSFDPSFGEGGAIHIRRSRNEELLAVTLQTDGKLVATGRFRAARGSRWVVRRFLADGTPDPAFAGRGKLRVRPNRNGGYPLEILPRSDGRLIATGVASGDGDIGDVTVLALSDRGRRVATFGRRGLASTNVARFDIGNGAALQADGKVVVAAGSESLDWGEQWVVLRYLDDGSLDPTFGMNGVVTTNFGGDAEAYAVAVQPDGRIVVAGEASGGVGLTRYEPDGTLDASFGVDGRVRTPIDDPAIASAHAEAIALQADGRIVVTGAACSGVYIDCPFHFLARYEGN